MAKLFSRTSGSQTLPITAHRGFVPLIAAWFAAFLGLGVLVLPGAQIARITMAADLTFLGGFSRVALTLVAAVVGAVIGYLIAVAVQNLLNRQPNEVASSSPQSVAPTAKSDKSTERSRLIVPSLDLGSSSLDEPVTPHPLLAEREPQSDEDIFADFERPDQATDPIEPGHDELQDDDSATHFPWDDALNLDNAVDDWADHGSVDQAWLEDEPSSRGFAKSAPPLDLDPFADQPVSGKNPAGPDDRKRAQDATDILALSQRVAPGSAIDSLRGKRPEELSLVQMVERFAAALHERQAKAPMDGTEERDATLAEGLRALALLAGEQPGGMAPSAPSQPRASDTQRELRDALSKLRDLSGAA